jgi:hypothetical protein
MSRCSKRILAVCSLLFGSALQQAAGSQAVLTVANSLPIPRPGETVVLPAADLRFLAPAAELRKIHVKDRSTERDLTCQVVDLDADGTGDQLLFQTDLGPGEARTFTLEVGEPRFPAREEFKAYGRFVRERFDDFAWENDRIAHRMYGTALETWQKEPLTSSGVDIWCKRTRRLVINDWYMIDDYHRDNGEGGDFYSVGRSRGCGGSAIWNNGKLHGARNFVNSRVIACGPIRVMFELTYAPWDVNGAAVAEVKRITLDAGANLDHFESFYSTDLPGELTYAVGIRNNPGSTVLVRKEEGWLRTWETFKGEAGQVGCGIVLDPAAWVDSTEADGNYLVVARAAGDKKASYYAGFGWVKSGDFANPTEWENYLGRFAQRLKSPVSVSLSRP